MCLCVQQDHLQDFNFHSHFVRAQIVQCLVLTGIHSFVPKIDEEKQEEEEREKESQPNQTHGLSVECKIFSFYYEM